MKEVFGLGGCLRAQGTTGDQSLLIGKQGSWLLEQYVAITDELNTIS